MQFGIIGVLKRLALFSTLWSKFLRVAGDCLGDLFFKFLRGGRPNWRLVLIIGITIQYLLWTLVLFLYILFRLYVLFYLWDFADPGVFYGQNVLFCLLAVIHLWLLYNIAAFYLLWFKVPNSSPIGSGYLLTMKFTKLFLWSQRITCFIFERSGVQN